MSDLPTLTGPSRPPAGGGPAKQLVILLHGLGADGNDLIDLASAVGRVLPEAAFVAPDAPFPCDMAPFGRQWFSFQNLDPVQLPARVTATAPILDAFIDQSLATYGLTDRDLALFGFSQGCMMALHVALRRKAPCAAVLGYSGALVGVDTLAGEMTARPPIFLAHGDQDPVVRFESLSSAEAVLRGVGIAVTAVPRPGVGHGIDPDGLAQGTRFLVQAFQAAQTDKAP